MRAFQANIFLCAFVLSSSGYFQMATLQAACAKSESTRVDSARSASDKSTSDKSASAKKVALVSGASARALSDQRSQTSQSTQFAEAQALYRQGKYEEALAVIKKIKDSGVDDYLVRSHMAANLFMIKPLIYPLAEARLAVKMNPRSATANTNLGILLQRNGERSAAIEKYRAAAAIDPNDWRAHVGIAQCLVVDGADGRVIAERELKLARSISASDNAAVRFYALGSTYLVMHLYSDAEDCFKQALKSRPSDLGENGEERAQLGLLKAALAAGDTRQVSELVPIVLKSEILDDKATLALALPGARLDSAQLNRLFAIAEKKFAKAEQFFYQFGRNLEASSQLELASRAYMQAVLLSSSSANVLSLIANRAQAGQLDEARQLTAQYVPEKNGKASGHNKDIFAQSLRYAQQMLADGQESNLHILNVQFSNIKCGCRIPVIEFSLRGLPGVIFARLQDEKDPHACIIYDSKVSNSQAIVSIKRDDDKVEVLSDQPVKSLPELVKIIQTAADKPDKNIFTLWSFEPPPMELPK